MSLIKAIKDIKVNKDLLVTPRMVEYLSDPANAQGTITNDDLVEVAVSILTDTSNSIRHGRFGSSSRGTCLRSQLFAYVGMPGQVSMDYKLHNVFQDGHYRHLRWQMMGLDAGIFTHVEVPFALPKYNLTGSIDALNEDEGWLFELKGAYRIPTEVPEKHLLQIHTYFLATGYDRCSYVVEDKASQEWREWVVKRDPKIIDEVRKELNDLNRALETRELPEPLEECRDHEGAWKKCPYRKHCLGTDTLPKNRVWR